MIAVCADGAGSAANAGSGSQIVCSAFTAAAREAIAQPPERAAWDRGMIEPCIAAVRAALEIEAKQANIEMRELASTLLAVIASPTRALCAQIGDGGIVIATNGQCELAFWPQNGEYANTTNFVTDDEALAELEVREFTGANALALFSDGLECVAIDFAGRKAFAPFFQPLFQALRTAQDPATLQQELQSFLDSPRINDRTDDDKTLILATGSSDGPQHATV